MSKKKKIAKVSKSEVKVAETEEAKRRRSKNTAIITASIILTVIFVVVVTFWYIVYKAPLQRTVIKVNDDKVKIGYLVNRCLMNIKSTSDIDIQGNMQNIVYELLLKQAAPQYGITVTEEDIDQELRDEANQSSTATTGTETTTTMSDAEFEEWYRQTVNQSQLSEKEFRDLIRANIIYQRLQTLLGDNMSTTAEQVHLYDILLQDYNTAAEIKTRIEQGEDFMTIASELSLDTATKDQGGDMGWLPVKVLDTNFEYAVTNLDIGQVSDPVISSTDASSASSSTDTETVVPYYLFMVTEKAVAREVDAKYIDYLKSRLISDWFSTQLSTAKGNYYGKGSSGGYDSETEAWLYYQIVKLMKSRGIEETTSTTATS
jgi:foldase protein PrsA